MPQSFFGVWLFFRRKTCWISHDIAQRRSFGNLFLGYDSKVQKENMLYLNMLYNMTEYGIEHGFKK